jgi:predicted ATPase/DNA-binding SARP family transcriptional activator
MTKLSLRLLGSPEIKYKGQSIATDRRKAIAMLVYLALEPGKHRRDTLATLFWGDYPQSDALAYLRRTIWEINQLNDEPVLKADRAGVQLIQDEGWVDVEQLFLAAGMIKEDQAASSYAEEDLLQLIRHYRGPFLAGFSLRDAPSFDEWQLVQSERARKCMDSVLAFLSARLDEHGRYEPLLENCLKWVEIDPLNENAQRALISAYAKTGQRSAALRQFNFFSQSLAEALEVAPEPETLALVEAIRRGQFSASKTQQQAGLPVAANRPTELQQVSLPAYSGPLIGRETELDQLAQLLGRDNCQLLTVLGPGGIGKTRLVVEAAKQVIGQFPDGVFFVPLVQLSHPDQMLESVASVIGCELRTEDTTGNPRVSIIQQLHEFLNTKNLLVILDNMEHLVDGSLYLSDLLSSTPGLKILVTSRIRLQLREENLLELDGLRQASHSATLASSASPAATLFCDRARQMNPEFNPDERTREQIEEIGRLVNGSPLAIELAASWSRLLTPEEIAEQIKNNLDFLSARERNIPTRHQSIRAVFETSWKMLSPGERQIFSKLALYRSGFTLESARQTAGASISDLAHLADQSLIANRSGDRFSIHELLRQYGVEKLVELDIRQQVETEYAAYHLKTLTNLMPFFIGPKIAQALLVVDQEFENFRQAFEYGAVHKLWDLILDSFTSLLLYLQIRNRLQDGWMIFSRLVEQLEFSSQDSPAEQPLEALARAFLTLYCTYLESSPTPTGSNCRTLYEKACICIERLQDDRSRYLAWLALNFGYPYRKPESSYQLMEEAQAHFSTRKETWLTGLVVTAMAEYVLFYARDIARAETLYKQSLQYAIEIQSPWFQATNLQYLANASLSAGKYQAAIQYAQQSLDICRDLHLKWHVIDIQLTMGRTAVALGDYQQAIAYYLENLDLMQQSGDRVYTAVHYDCLGYAYLLLKQYHQAETAYRQALALYQRQGYAHGIGMALSNLGEVAQASGDLQAAISCYQQGLDYLEQVEGLWGIEVTRKKLGQTYWLLGEITLAVKQYFLALKLAVQLERDPEILEILTYLIPYFSQSGQTLHAQRLIQLVRTHPATAENIRQQAEQLRTYMKDEISAADTNTFQLPVAAALKSLQIFD